ncbi:NADH-cytochrome b5 reductase 2-like isoform X2 [Cephus cinctus]|uniref:NADH-cytochrome b5 reductase n=2 Tax=Cephus cinctus TaxID=211228 RepID=A0AAJ7RHB7_CEPCN|nr:NADH-cytochrome b5 reductase 2-like isoform X2 [Cephus cinctus]XP_024940918.1 NADH-cytochrome b5 reductase 2-like isoform X2 [Cephus cinctus]
MPQGHDSRLTQQNELRGSSYPIVNIYGCMVKKLTAYEYWFCAASEVLPKMFVSPKDTWGVLCIVVALGAIASVSVALKIYNSVTKERSKNKTPLTLLDPTVKYTLPLLEKEIVSHDTRRFRFALPSPNHVLGLPPGQHVYVSAHIGELVTRAYSPVSSDNDHGFVDIIVKVYFKNTDPKFPQGGKMSQYLNNLKIGDTLDFRGPAGRLVYEGCGNIKIKNFRKEPIIHHHVKKMVMIAGGSGITPILRIIRHVLDHPEDNTHMNLIYANRTEKDILLRNELDNAAKEHCDQFTVWYTLSNPDKDWAYSTGHINANMIQEHSFPPSSDTIILMCGPGPMINLACSPNFDKLGYDSKLRFIF